MIKDTQMKNEKFSPVTIVVAANGKFRAFTTERFSIRPFCLMMQRYGTDQHIVCMLDGTMPEGSSIGNKWSTAEVAELADELCKIQEHRKIQWCDIDDTLTLQQLLTSKESYRLALNTYYCQRFNSGQYPSEEPFKGVTIDIHPLRYRTLARPVFLPDQDNREKELSDILRWYDGYRIRKLIQGIEVSGYMLRKSRFK